MTTFHAITTAHSAGWEDYGRRMAQSFADRWPQTIPLTVYNEDFEVDVDGINSAVLPEWLTEFKARHKTNRDAHGRSSAAYDFKRDCVRFAHKVAAITDAAKTVKADVLIWIDADTFTHAPVPTMWLGRIFPSPSYIAWLDRPGSYPECGFLMFRANNPQHQPIMERLEQTYRTDDVFRYRETHDSFVIQQIIEAAVKRREIPPPTSLSGPRKSGHPFINGPLSQFMDHMKGARKVTQRTPAAERKIHDANPYWRR